MCEKLMIKIYQSPYLICPENEYPPSIKSLNSHGTYVDPFQIIPPHFRWILVPISLRFEGDEETIP